MDKIKDCIIVKDNFFESKIYNEILLDISRLKFQNRSTIVNKESDNIYQKIYFSVPLNPNHFALQEAKKITEKNLHAKISLWESSYFLSTKHTTPTPHFDTTDINCLVYLKGNLLLNSGTGFYNKVGDEFVLNTHVGFKENRAIIFDSKIYHCSLQFNENTDLRYVMANFFNYEV